MLHRNESVNSSNINDENFTYSILIVLDKGPGVPAIGEKSYCKSPIQKHYLERKKGDNII
jgi:hypothetical protein